MSDTSTSGDTGQARTACYAATFEGSGCLGTVTDGQCSEQDDHHPTPGMLPYDGPGAELADTGQSDEEEFAPSGYVPAQAHLLVQEEVERLRAEVDRLRSPSPATGQAPDSDGPSDHLVITAAAGRLRAMADHHRREFSHILLGVAQWMEMAFYIEDNASEEARALRSARALLGIDTAPVVKR